ncbi:MAG: NAD(P) transhydrogenase subunit alpha [Planctomycetota bacterium]
MMLFAPRPEDPHENRAALTPAVVKKLVAKGVTVVVETGLAHGAFIGDDAFREAGATTADEGHQAWEDADVVVAIDPTRPEHVRRMRPGTALVGMLSPTTEHDLVRTAVKAQVSTISLEFVPRISRAQSMDVLSSQANLAGYKAVLLGANHCPKLMPMMITAAGTLAPARVLVVGVGVAGLQAIATAKRLGAIVEAYDVRPATKEQVQSLGARFVELPTSESAGETSGGYAKEQTEEDRARQAELMAKHVTGADVVVTTAAVFGKAPPMLIPADVVHRMRPGSVVVDLAANPAHGRGNCELTQPGEVVTTDNQVTVVGTTNLPATLPVDASTVFANNVFALLETMIDTPAEDQDNAEPTFKLDPDDEIHAGVLITHAGEIANDLVRETLDGKDSP